MIYSIGYQSATIAQFIQTLKENEIEVLVDVRTVAWSRNRVFKEKHLKFALNKAHIGYIHEVNLGGKEGKRPEGYDEALTGLIALSESQKVAFMCLETDPEKCHRGKWITPDLLNKGVEVRHLFVNLSVSENARLEQFG